MQTWRFTTILAASCTSLACGSDPKAEPDEASPRTTPDYTRSPCYGAPRTTRVYDAETHGTREVAATCRAEGEQTLVYVADDLWELAPTAGGPVLGQRQVNAFMAGFELEGRPTSFQPDLGVLAVDELVFGSLPDALPDGKLPVFVVDSGGAGEGYLCSWCDGIEFHLDGPLLGSLDSDKTLSIAAHETVHVIHRGHDTNETVWVDETLAQAAMTVNGFFTDGDWLDDFLGNTNVAWGPGVDNPLDYHYGAGLLFGSYLWEHGGRGLLRAITSEPLDDWAGIDAALAKTGDSKDGWSLFLDMGLATFLDDPATGYSFDAFELQGQLPATVTATGTSRSGVIQPYGLVFVAFESDARSVTLDTGTNVSSRLVLGGRPTEVVELTLGEPFEVDASPRVLLLSAPRATTFSLSVR
ncbi:MAG TPA: hypothetical protein VMS65_17480 [Polyangiaceae bacterium]|nr:hypothetical protein [Polyangiaceae bacterium]